MVVEGTYVPTYLPRNMHTHLVRQNSSKIPKTYLGLQIGYLLYDLSI